MVPLGPYCRNIRGTAPTEHQLPFFRPFGAAAPNQILALSRHYFGRPLIAFLYKVLQHRGPTSHDQQPITHRGPTQAIFRSPL